MAGGWRGLYIDTVRTAIFGQGSSPQPPGGDAAGLSHQLDLCAAPATDEVGSEHLGQGSRIPLDRMFSAMTSLGGRPVIVGGSQYRSASQARASCGAEAVEYIQNTEYIYMQPSCSNGWKYRNSTLVFMVELGLWQEVTVYSQSEGIRLLREAIKKKRLSF